MTIRKRKSAGKSSAKKTGKAAPTESRQNSRMFVYIGVLLTNPAQRVPRRALIAAVRRADAEVSDRTISRDLRELERRQFLRSENVNGSLFYRLDEMGIKMKSVALDVTDFLSLTFAVRSLADDNEAIVSRRLLSLATRMAESASSDALRKAVRVLEEQNRDLWRTARVEFLETIQSALEQGLALRMDYRDSVGKRTQNRVVYPLELFVKGHTYLRAHCTSCHEERNFLLERIESLAVEENPSTPRPKLKPKYATDDQLSAYFTEPMDIHLVVNSALRGYLEKHHIHKSQCIRSDRDGRMHVTLHCSVGRPTVTKLAALGTNIYDVKPQILKDALLEHHRQSLAALETGVPRNRDGELRLRFSTSDD